MVIFKKVSTLFNSNILYGLLIFVVLLISYGQMLNMYIWKDDNAIFFKFTHLEEQTGYLGKGLLGEGLYRFSVAPYYLIFKIFGYEYIQFYYLLIFVSLLICTLIIYKFFSYLMNRRTGLIASFLFVSGYIAEEGFIWLASSMIQIVSIALTILTLYFYFKFIKTKRFTHYLISLFFYFLALYITPVRVHYLIIVVIVLNLLYFFSIKSIKSVIFTLVRIVPFAALFYISYLKNPDQRTSLSIDFITSLLKGEFFKLYSFFGSLGNMILIDRLNEIIFNKVHSSNANIGLLIIAILIVIISILGVVLFKPKKYILLYGGFSLIWVLLTYFITMSTYLNSNIQGITAFAVGGIFLGAALLTAFIQKPINKVLIILITWLSANLFVYSSYIPTTIYPTTDRYLAHSFIPLIGIFVVILSLIPYKSWWYSLIFLLVVGWGIINIIISFNYQRNIIEQVYQSLCFEIYFFQGSKLIKH